MTEVSFSRFFKNRSGKTFIDSFYEAFPDFVMQICDTIPAHERLVLRVTYFGTHKGEFMGIPATGCDVMMPGMDGGELAFRFRENPQLESVPIVFLTAAVTKREVERGGGWVGGAPFLAKPITIPELVDCLEHYLGAQGISAA